MKEFNYGEFTEHTLLPVNENLKYYKKDRGVSSEYLAEKAYCVRRTIDRYIKGDYEMPSETAELIAKALDISIEELTGENTRLEHGIKKRKDKVIQRAMEIAKALNKTVNDLTSQDLQLKGGIEEKEIDEIDAEKEYEKIYWKQSVKCGALNTSNLILNEISKIQQFLNISDSDIIWIKEVLLHYFVLSDIFVNNMRCFYEDIYELTNILNNEESSRDILIKDLLVDSDEFINKLNNAVEDMRHMSNIRKEICEMVMLFAKIHECRG